MAAQAFDSVANPTNGQLEGALKAWEKAPCGHFFDDIDTVLHKLKVPHEDELLRLYQDDRRNIDPLSPSVSDDEEDDDDFDHFIDEPIEDNVLLEQLAQFDYIDADFLEQCSASDITDCVITSPDELELCPDEYARFYELDPSELRLRKSLSETGSQRLAAKRLASLFYDLHVNLRNQWLACLAYYLKHKFPVYKSLLRDYLSGILPKPLFESVLSKLFAGSTNSLPLPTLFDLHNEFILSLFPSISRENARKDRQMQPYCDIDLAFFTKLYQYQKRKRTTPVFCDLFHSEIPEISPPEAPENSRISDCFEYSFEVDNLQVSGSTKHRKCPTSFLNTKYYMDQFWLENGQFLPDPEADFRLHPNKKFEQQVHILEKLWLTELTQAFGIPFGLETFEKYDITRRKFASWFRAQVKHFRLAKAHCRNGQEVKFVDLRIHTPTECDEDYCPMLFSLRKLPVSKISHFRSVDSDRKLLGFRELSMRFCKDIGGDMKRNKILFVDKRAVEVAYLALMKFMRNAIQELLLAKANFRKSNKKFDRFRIIDGIVAKPKTEYYSDLHKEINAKGLEDILLDEKDREYSQNLFYRSMLENEHFDMPENPLNDLDFLAALQNSDSLLPNRQVWLKVKQRLLTKFSQITARTVTPPPPLFPSPSSPLL